MNPTRLKKASTIFVYWSDGRLVFQNYRSGVAMSAHPSTVEVLNFFHCWRTRAEFYRHAPQYTRGSLNSVMRQLVQLTFLVKKGSKEARSDNLLTKAWSSWLPEAGILHFGTKDAPYGTSGRRVERILRRFLEESRQPPTLKSYRHRPRLHLPEVHPGRDEFLRVLLARRTHRVFSAELLSLRSLSELLFYTWGITGLLRTPVLGSLPLKTSPSAGARHPGEVYVVALRVEGLRPGLYHYAPARHALEQLHSANMQKRAVEYCAGQRWVGKAAALFLMTAVFGRSMWKYRSPRAYRTVLLDAGHLCQTLCLVATSLGLAPFCTMALKDSVIERELGLDGVTESVLYVAGVGVPPRADVMSSRASLRRASRYISEALSA